MAESIGDELCRSTASADEPFLQGFERVPSAACLRRSDGAFHARPRCFLKKLAVRALAKVAAASSYLVP